MWQKKKRVCEQAWLQLVLVSKRIKDWQGQITKGLLEPKNVDATKCNLKPFKILSGEMTLSFEVILCGPLTGQREWEWMSLQEMTVMRTAQRYTGVLDSLLKEVNSLRWGTGINRVTVNWADFKSTLSISKIFPNSSFPPTFKTFLNF